MRTMLRRSLVALALVQASAATADALHVPVRGSLTLPLTGATAVFAVDGSIVDAGISEGQVVLAGRRAGQTLVTVITTDDLLTLVVTVDAAGSATMWDARSGAAAPGSLLLGYDSALQRYQAGLDLPFGDNRRSGRLQVLALQETTPLGDQRWGVPSARLAFRTPELEAALFDETVRASPLTLDGTVLRGLHAATGRLDLHAGIAATDPWSDHLLPAEGDRALTAGYRFGDDGLAWSPRLLLLPDSSAAVPGVASLGIAHGAPDAAFRWRGEIGWSEHTAGSLDLDLRTTARTIWLQGMTRPDGFAALPSARPPGDYLDGAWTEQLGRLTAVTLAGSTSRLDLAGWQPQADSLRLDLRQQLTRRLSATLGTSDSRYLATGSAPVRRHADSAGVAFDDDHFGIALLYRRQTLDGLPGVGEGGRLSLRARGGGWRASLFADAQQQAATLDLLLQQRPDIGLALAELGLAAATPEELLQLLSQHTALLAEHGVAPGPLRLHPLRLQGGLDIMHASQGTRPVELGLRVTADRLEGQGDVRDALLATLYSRWHPTPGLEVDASGSCWRDDDLFTTRAYRTSWQVTLRHRLASAAFPGSGRRALRGKVWRDDSGSWTPGHEAVPLADVEVVLDGVRRARSDVNGEFVFDAPGPGEHRVEALLPPQPGAYFTRPSAVTTTAGDKIEFALTVAAARLDGTLRNDAGLPLPGVTLRLRGVRDATTVTDGSGRYRFAGPEGMAQVEVMAESLPPGYDLTALKPQSLLLARHAPAHADFRARALRSLAGTVKGLRGIGVVEVAGSGQQVRPDAAGHFLLRHLPAGRLTLVVRHGGGEIRQDVEVPAEPGIVSGVVIEAGGRGGVGLSPAPGPSPAPGR